MPSHSHADEETTTLAPAIAGYTLLDDEDDDFSSLDEAMEDENNDSLPFLKKQKTGHLHRYRVLPPSPAVVAYYEALGQRVWPWLFYWKHLRQDHRGKWVSYPCLSRNKGGKKDCPDCEMFFTARAQAETEDEKRAAKEYQSKKRAIFCVIDRENEEAGPQIMELSAPWTNDADKLAEMPETQWQKFQKIFRIHKKDVVRPDAKGFDFTFLKSGKDRGTNYEISASDSPSALSEDAELANSWIANQPDLTQIIKLPTLEEVGKILGAKLTDGGGVEQLDPSRALAAGPASETAEDVLDAEFNDTDDDWD